MARKSNIMFIIIFFMVISLPALFAHRTPNRISDSENRTLANFPSIKTGDNQWNLEYTVQFENWIEDNVRARTLAMELNTTLQYKLFGKIAKENLWIGTNGELYGANDKTLSNYQHLNLLTNEELDGYENALLAIQNKLEKQGIDFYYMQCYDKESIYEEHFMEGVNQFGDKSLAWQVESALLEHGQVHVIPIYELLEKNKNTEKLYFQVIDSFHWGDRGIFLGYNSLIDTIQKKYPQVNQLTEADMTSVTRDEQTSIYGFTYPIHETTDDLYVTHPNATEIIPYPFENIRYKEHTHYYQNQNVDNDLKILAIGDSYIRMEMKQYIAESFKETLSIDWLNIQQIDQVIEQFEPDIVLVESAELFLQDNVSMLSKNN